MGASCPNDITRDIDVGSRPTPRIYWSTPTPSVDLSGNVSLVWQSHSPGNRFDVGDTTVKYVFANDSGSEEICIFVVTVREGKILFNTNRLL